MQVLNTAAENIIRRNIQMSGRNIEYKRPIPNKYGETDDSYEITVIQKSIYHLTQEGNFTFAKQGDAGKAVTSKREMLLTFANPEISVGDYCSIGNKMYRIYDITNYCESDKFYDMKLEEVRKENELNTGTRNI